MKLLETFLRRIEHSKIPVVAGIWPLVSVRNAEFMKNELRVSVPDSILERMAAAQSPEAAREEGIAIAGMRRQCANGAGSPDQRASGRYSSAADVLEALGMPRVLLSPDLGLILESPEEYRLGQI